MLEPRGPNNPTPEEETWRIVEGNQRERFVTLEPGAGSNCESNQTSRLAASESLVRYLSQGNRIETRVSSTRAGDREYFPPGARSSVPDLERFSERELLEVLSDLHQRGLILRTEESTSCKDGEQRVYWSLRDNQAEGPTT